MSGLLSVLAEELRALNSTEQFEFPVLMCDHCGGPLFPQSQSGENTFPTGLFQRFNWAKLAKRSASGSC